MYDRFMMNLKFILSGSHIDHIQKKNYTRCDPNVRHSSVNNTPNCGRTQNRLQMKIGFLAFWGLQTQAHVTCAFVTFFRCLFFSKIKCWRCNWESFQVLLEYFQLFSIRSCSLFHFFWVYFAFSIFLAFVGSQNEIIRTKTNDVYICNTTFATLI